MSLATTSSADEPGAKPSLEVSGQASGNTAPTSAQVVAGAPQPKSEESLSDIGAKLANPLAALWSLQFSLNAPQFYDGDINEGDPETGAALVFQPVMHIPLFGSGDDQWGMITRPIIPFVLSAPIPKGLDSFDHKGGIGDIQVPFLLSPARRITGNFIAGGGPVFQFPSATNGDLGQDQWAMGPAVVLGYKTKSMTLGVFPNYLWKIGSAGQGSEPDTNQGSLLYFFNYMLPGAWQFGVNPTITYNDNASSGNKWNVPVGPYIGRTIRVGNLPLNIRVGGEYSVVSPDDFGQRFQFRVLITPVIPSLIQNPILGNG
jgi:hypothetical protein